MKLYQIIRLLILLGFLLLAVVRYVHGQTPTYYHDPALDTIANNIGFMDADMNAKAFGTGITGQQYHQTNINDTISIQGGLFTNNYVVETNTIMSPISTNIALFGGAISNVFQVFSNVIPSTNPQAFDNDGQINGSVSPLSTTFSVPGNSSGITKSFSIDWSITDAIDATGATWLYYLIAGLYYCIIAVYALHSFLDIWGEIWQNIDRFMQQRQIQGTEQGILGTNVALPTALAYGIITTGILLGVITVILTSNCISITGSYTWMFLSNSSPITTAIHSTSFVQTLWSDITFFIPVHAMETIFFSTLIFRYGVMPFGFMLARGVVRLLPA